MSPKRVAGCGFTAPPGSHETLAAGLVTLLRDEALASTLGRRAHARVARKFGKAACLDGYHRVLSEVTGRVIEAPLLPEDERTAIQLALHPNENDDESGRSGAADVAGLAELVRRSAGPGRA